MNQKDYKEIAGIIKINIEDVTQRKEMPILKILANDLASYFEKEVLEHRKERHEEKGFNGCPSDCWCWDFNEQQFLKDCGVE